ncbi:MAG: CDP-diacylglycerol--serine O-phosphatidyltransferase [Gemmatimonadales bacterium]
MNAPRNRTGMRRAIVILPGAFTTGNLFFGIFAIVEATRGNYAHASWFILAGGVLDGLDGSAARMTRTGTAFGAELDSLVDAVTFGVAPALLVYFHTFRTGEWAWLLSFLFILAVVLRLARFNVEQAGHAKSQFFGLPSPGAGILIASYYPFSQTPFFAAHLASILGTPLALAVMMVGCSLLMVSHVPYPTAPRPGIKSAKGLLTMAAILVTAALVLYVPAYFVFPALAVYVVAGVLRAVLLGLLERRPEREPLTDELEEEDDAGRPVDDELMPRLLPFRVRRRRRGGTP